MNNLGRRETQKADVPTSFWKRVEASASVIWLLTIGYDFCRSLSRATTGNRDGFPVVWTILIIKFSECDRSSLEILFRHEFFHFAAYRKSVILLFLLHSFRVLLLTDSTNSSLKITISCLESMRFMTGAIMSAQNIPRCVYYGPVGVATLHIWRIFAFPFVKTEFACPDGRSPADRGAIPCIG